ncbi:MAG: DNA topoisomerase 4 subunit A [Anaerolineae bacterium]|nr:DNA topoisomerase 4 subunit A [Anaerolineae bacterium]
MAKRSTAPSKRSGRAEQQVLDLSKALAPVEKRKTIELADELGYAYREYAHYTLLDRAIADVRDGFKPVHRRIIYAMGEMNLGPTSQHRKSARVVGEVLGKYHPHGDQSVYDALARMAQDFSLRDVLVDGQGNFGSIDGDAPAAMRYTEVRMSALGAEILRDIDMDTVNWQDNFDNSLKEPAVLPAAFPNVLVNGSSGIAVGFAANLAPHNLGEVCDGVTLMCEGWKRRAKITIDELIKAIPGPDFPTGGLIFRYRFDRVGNEEVKSDAIKAAYETGQAGLVCQARMDVDANADRVRGSGRGGGTQIVITEIPYGLQKSTIIQRIASEAREGKITGVTDIIDESDRDGMRIVVQVSRQADANDVLEMLIRRTALRSTFGVNNLVLVPRGVNGGRIVEPETLGLKEILEQFVLHRLEIIQRRSRYELERRKQRLHIVEGLLIALDNIDEVIDTIRRSRTVETAHANLMHKFKLTEIQATAILDMQLRRLAAMERTKLKEEEKELKARIKYLEDLLASEAKQLGVIKEETAEIKKKYATPRRTTIIDAAPGEGEAIVTETTLAIPTNPQTVVVTTQGILRVDSANYAYRVSSGATGRAVVAHRMRVDAQPTDKILIVSSGGRVWIGPVGQLPEDGPFDKLGLKQGETVVYLRAIGEQLAKTPEFLILGTKQGRVKRTAMESVLQSAAANNWSEAIGLVQGDQVVFAGVCTDKGEVLFFTDSKVLHIQAETVSDQPTPSARGVTGIQLTQEDTLLGGSVFSDPDRQMVLIVSEKGYMKQVPIVEFPVKGRGTQGIQSLTKSKATGNIAAVAAGRITGRTSVDVLAADGKRQRAPVASIPVEKRANQGKKLIELAQPTEIIIWD